MLAHLALGLLLPTGPCARAPASGRVSPPRCCAEVSLPADAGADDAEGGDDLECTGRVVTELVETGSGAALPDRFMMVVQAMRGDFTPGEGVSDTERDDDVLTAALTTFPAAVKLRVVSKPLADEAAEALEADLRRLAECVEGAGDAVVRVTPRGRRRSIDFELSAVPDLAALRAVRSALREDERVQMLF